MDELTKGLLIFMGLGIITMTLGWLTSILLYHSDKGK